MGPEDVQQAPSRMKKNRMHYSHPPSPWHQAPGDDARMGPKNSSETLKSLEEVRATLKAQLKAVDLAIDLFKTTDVTYQRPPFAQRPVSRLPSSSNERASTGTAVNTAEASSPSISDDETAPASETSSDELEASSRQPLSSFMIKLRPRGCRGKESTAKSKAKYEAKKEERTSKAVPKGNCVSVFKNGKENIDLNAVDGRSKKVSDENNVANKRCEKKLFAPLSRGKNQFIPIGGDTTASEKKAVSLLFPPTEHEVLSSGGEDESAAHDQTRVNSYKKEQDVDPHQGTNGFSAIGGDLPTEHEVLSSGVNGFSSIGGERETAVEETAAPHQNRVNSSEDEEDADDHHETTTGQDNLEACGGDVIPQVQARVYAPRLSDKERLSNVRYFWTLEQTLKAAQDKARLHLDEDPPFLRKYQCEECGVNPTCCLLKFKRQEGPNATCPLNAPLMPPIKTCLRVYVTDSGSSRRCMRKGDCIL